MDTVKDKKKQIVKAIVLVCICLIAGGVLYYLYFYPNRPLGMEGDARQYHYDKVAESLRQDGPQVKLDLNASITVNGKSYYCLSARDRVKYGLLEESFVEEGLKPVYPRQNYDPNWYKHHFIRGDIGKYMGKVEDCFFEFLVGLKVYHYSAYPDSDEICILKLGDGYGYVFYGLWNFEN